jgi:hypothetical protein
MTSYNTDLLVNISRKAPWILEDDQTFFPENVQGDAMQALDNIKDYDLTLITESGRVFRQYLILRLKGDKVIIDKPSEWDDSVTSFHVFFRNSDNKWNFFQVNGSTYNQEAITVMKPYSIYLLQKRRFKRTLTPLGTRVIFRNDRQMIDSAFIHDISEGGMHIWTSGPRESYLVNSIIDEVFISLPTEEDHSGASDTSHRVLPYITKGKIMRTNTARSSSISHYGVSFIHENILLQRRFNSLIAALRNQSSIESAYQKGINFAAGHHQKLSPNLPDC